MLDDGWVRIQLYIPEHYRWKLRSTCDEMSDSRKCRDILIYVLNNFSEDDICDMLTLHVSQDDESRSDSNDDVI